MPPDIDILEFGLVGIALIIIYKLIDRVPMFKNDHTRHALLVEMTKVVKSLETATTAMIDESRKQTTYLKSLDEAHTAPYALRNNGSYRWHNDPDREKEIKETHQTVMEIRQLMAKGADG